MQEINVVNMGDARIFWQISRICAIALKLIFFQFITVGLTQAPQQKKSGKTQYNDAFTLRLKGGSHRHQDHCKYDNDGSNLLVR